MTPRRFAPARWKRCSRYTTSGFLRIKLGQALEGRGLAPHIFESADEARLDAHQESGPR
jgi:propionate CoA-transferase